MLTAKSTIMEAFEEYKKLQNWTRNTLSGYIRDVKLMEDFLCHKYIEPVVGNIQAQAVVFEWIHYLLEIKKETRKSVERRVRTLQSLYSFLVKNRVVEVNPFVDVKVDPNRNCVENRQPRKNPTDLLSLNDLKSVYQILPSIQGKKEGIEVPIKFAMLTACDFQLMEYLKVKHIDFEKGMLFYQGKGYGNRNLIRISPIPPSFLEKLKMYVESKGLGPEDLLFRSLSGKPFKRNNINEMVKRINESLMLEDEHSITPKQLKNSLSHIIYQNYLLSLDMFEYRYDEWFPVTLEGYYNQSFDKIEKLRNILSEYEVELECQQAIKENIEIDLDEFNISEIAGRFPVPYEERHFWYKFINYIRSYNDRVRAGHPNAVLVGYVYDDLNDVFAERELEERFGFADSLFYVEVDYAMVAFIVGFDEFNNFAKVVNDPILKKLCSKYNAIFQELARSNQEIVSAIFKHDWSDEYPPFYSIAVV